MIKSFVVGVSDYNLPNCKSLPLCLNDIYAFRNALVLGLSAKEENIFLCGKNKKVLKKDFETNFISFVDTIENDDTFIFYFSGHGAKQGKINYLVFSDTLEADALISIDEIINIISSINCKNKVVIIDSCHSGNSNNFNSIQKLDINETADKFVGIGCAIMAACDIDEESGFDAKSRMSLYTRIVCDALTNRFTIREGKKSLEEIVRIVDRVSEIENAKRTNKQHANFRSDIVGTIFFDVEDYHPYEKQKIFKETNEYIIYSVEPVHAGIVKRYSIKVILKFPFDKTEISIITNKIKNEALYYDVYSNTISENLFKGKRTNVIFCYFGYSIEDMANNNYAFRANWVDDNQDRGYWYKKSKDAIVINDVIVYTNNSYSFLREYILNNTSDSETIVKNIRSCIYQMIELTETYIRQFREYKNNIITTEDELMDNVEKISQRIRKLYLEYTDLPIVPVELKNWESAYSNLAATIDDFCLCYDKNNKRDSNNRFALTEQTIRRYYYDLEKIKEVDKEFQFNN